MLLTVREAARFVRASERDIYRWIDRGEIPFQRVRGEFRFNRTSLLEWATAHQRPVSIEEGSKDEATPPTELPSLADALRAGGVHSIAAAHRDVALRSLLDLTPMPSSIDRDFLFDVLVARENLLSTAIGDGIAIPHVRQPIVAPASAPTISVGYLEEPLPFDSPDQRPVSVILLLVTPTVRVHLHMLALVARALLDTPFRASLRRKAALDELIEAISGSSHIAQAHGSERTAHSPQ